MIPISRLLAFILALSYAATCATAYYAPGQGRWLQRDSSGYVDGANLYVNVKSNPIKYTDPKGLCAMIPLHANDCAADVYNSYIDELLKAQPGASRSIYYTRGLPYGHNRRTSAEIEAGVNACLATAYISGKLQSKRSPMRRGIGGKTVPGPNGGQRDAFRHCIATCVLARCTNDTDFALDYMNAREHCPEDESDESGPSQVMDMGNNSVGAEAAEDKQDSCKEACWNRRSKFRTIQ